MASFALMTVYMLVAHALLFAGLGVASGRLLTDSLAFVHSAPRPVFYTGFALMLLGTNFLIVEGYRITPAAWAGPVQMVCGVLAMAVLAVTLDGARLTWQIAASVLVMSAAAVWVSIAIQQSARLNG